MSICDTEILSESKKDNREVLKIIQLSSQELVRLKGNEDFYDNNESANKFINIISGNCEISIRLIDHFVTKYSKYNKCTYKLNEEKEKDKEINFNVHYDYKNQLKHYQKTYFDPFSRGDRIPFFMNNTCIITTIGQLNFFKWFISKKIFDFLLEKKNEVYDDMNKKNKKDAKIIKKIYNNNYKKKDKNQIEIYKKPLIINPMKDNKQTINILVSFD
jgi:hypothetical protein